MPSKLENEIPYTKYILTINLPTWDYAVYCSSLRRVHRLQGCLTQGQTTSGVYVIKPHHQPAFQVYCDQHGHWWWWVDSVPAQRGWISQLLLLLGWLSERVWNFYCYWADYQKGFGNPSREFWLGLERIHHLTSTATQLRIDMQDFYGNTR